MAKDPKSVALVRYQIISPYLAANPPRGQRGALLKQLAARTWTGVDGEPLVVAAETLRAWVRRYRRHGLDGLEPKRRAKPGVQVLSEEEQQLICRLKREVPERSLDRIIEIAEGVGMAEPGRWRRSTVHRVLLTNGISARKARVPDVHDLDRFEADAPGDLWQSDLLKGPWLPDPARPGKVRQAKLYAFLDDHSRLLLYGRFHFSEALPHLELVFRQAVRRWGLCKRVYYDNGAVYRSRNMKQVVAHLGIHRIVFTRPYRPQGHGKIEALNRVIRSAFLAELKASNITTLDELNEAFAAWAAKYNDTVHTETGEAPSAAYKAVLGQVKFVEERALRQAFLWREKRTTDKTGVFSLFGRRYQASAKLAKRKVEVRYDAEALDVVELWVDDAFAERARPLTVQASRRPKSVPEPDLNAEPTADWLSHLVQEYRRNGRVGPTPAELAEQQRQTRLEQDHVVFELLRHHLAADAVDEASVNAWLERFGPLDPTAVEGVLAARLALGEPKDRHAVEWLDRIREDLHG